MCSRRPKWSSLTCAHPTPGASSEQLFQHLPFLQAHPLHQADSAISPSPPGVSHGVASCFCVGSVLKVSMREPGSRCPVRHWSPSHPHPRWCLQQLHQSLQSHCKDRQTLASVPMSLPFVAVSATLGRRLARSSRSRNPHQASSRFGVARTANSTSTLSCSASDSAH